MTKPRRERKKITTNYKKIAKPNDGVLVVPSGNRSERVPRTVTMEDCLEWPGSKRTEKTKGHKKANPYN